jgi:hypothetical protein
MWNKDDEVSYKALARLTIELVTKHGRDTALRTLREFGVDTVPDLTLRQVAAYRACVLKALARSVNEVPTQEEWDQHAKEYPHNHKGMLYRLSRIRRGLPGWTGGGQGFRTR